MCAAADPERGSTGHFGEHKGREFRDRQRRMERKTGEQRKPRKIDASLRLRHTILIDRTRSVYFDCYFKCPVQEKRPKTRSEKRLKESKNITQKNLKVK